MPKFQFDSLQAFFWMNGHGPYVWACFALAVVALMLLSLAPVIARRRFLRTLRHTIAREGARGNARYSPQEIAAKETAAAGAQSPTTSESIE